MQTCLQLPGRSSIYDRYPSTGLAIQRWLPVADRAHPPAVRTTAQPYTAGRPTPPATGKQQMRWICDPPLIPEIHHICNLLTAAAELALMSAWICNPGLPLKRICNSSAPQNSSAGRPKACSPRRWNHSRYTSPPDRRSGYLQGTSGAQVNCTKGLDRCGPARCDTRRQLLQNT